MTDSPVASGLRGPEVDDRRRAAERAAGKLVRRVQR